MTWKRTRNRESRCAEILVQRRRAIALLIKQKRLFDPRHQPILEGFAAGLTSRECAASIGCSYTWANLILRAYGLSTRERFSKSTRERALQMLKDVSDG
jgi:hypothetical protein